MINVEATGVEIPESPITITIQNNDSPSNNSNIDSNNDGTDKQTSSGGGSMGLVSVILLSLIGLFRRKVFVNTNGKIHLILSN